MQMPAASVASKAAAYQCVRMNTRDMIMNYKQLQTLCDMHMLSASRANFACKNNMHNCLANDATYIHMQVERSGKY